MEKIFNDILLSNKETIFRICLAYASQREEAEDMFQEVLLNIWRALPGFEHKSSISTWVYRITLNVCMRAKYNTERRSQVIHLKGIHWAEASDTTDSNKERDYERLYACIRKLEQADKALILMFLEDMPYRDISAVTGLSENHIAVKIKRIKSKLFNCLKQGQNE